MESKRIYTIRYYIIIRGDDRDDRDERVRLDDWNGARGARGGYVHVHRARRVPQEDTPRTEKQRLIRKTEAERTEIEERPSRPKCPARCSQ